MGISCYLERLYLKKYVGLPKEKCMLLVFLVTSVFSSPWTTCSWIFSVLITWSTVCHCWLFLSVQIMPCYMMWLPLCCNLLSMQLNFIQKQNCWKYFLHHFRKNYVVRQVMVFNEWNNTEKNSLTHILFWISIFQIFLILCQTNCHTPENKLC